MCALLGCAVEPHSVDDEGYWSTGETGSPGEPTEADEGSTSARTTDGTTGERDNEQDGTTSGTTGDGPKYDIQMTDLGPAEGTCSVVDRDAVPECDQEGPPDSFELDVQWTWTGPRGGSESAVLPLVGNLTDDDGNGTIDLCDVPDIVVATYEGDYDVGQFHVLDGATGDLHYTTEGRINAAFSPALGDIDGDGLSEIVTQSEPNGPLVAYEHDGSLAWVGDDILPFSQGTIALADVDADGDVEIIAVNRLYDHEGNLLVHFDGQAGAFGNFGSATTAVDLDGDGDLEVILGNSAWHHTGVKMWNAESLAPGLPAVADLDDDGEPEILLVSADGYSIIEHDGTITTAEARPTDASTLSSTSWHRPQVIHDFDDDGQPEFAVSAYDIYGVYELDMSIRWLAEVDDGSGAAGGTAFDFLGDGAAEAMYADEQHFWMYDDDGSVLLVTPRASWTSEEYPVVADVDNDGSAEIVVTSNAGYYGEPSPTVQVIRDVEDRWIQARRIWNQHAYHVTNVREDGTIPQHQPRHWESVNTFRANAQISNNGGICTPPAG